MHFCGYRQEYWLRSTCSFACLFVLDGDSVLNVQAFYPGMVDILNSQQEIPFCFMEVVLFSSNRSLHRDLKRLFTNEPSYMIAYYGLLIERGGLQRACEHAMNHPIACCPESAKFLNPPRVTLRAREHCTELMLCIKWNKCHLPFLALATIKHNWQMEVIYYDRIRKSLYRDITRTNEISVANMRTHAHTRPI